MKTFNYLLNNKWFYISVILILLFFLFSGFGRKPKNFVTTITKTDTIYVDRPYKEIIIQQVIKPQKVYVYKTDTIFREKLIRDTLISGISLTRKKAEIHTITPLGVPNINQYSLSNYDKLTIDHKGNLQLEPIKHPNRKKTWRIIKNVGIFIGGVFIGSQITK